MSEFGQLKKQNPRRKEVKTMKYEKPNVVANAAVTAIQSHTGKTTITVPDLGGVFKSNAAYEADE